jgi:hypothetical protein
MTPFCFESTAARTKKGKVMNAAYVRAEMSEGLEVVKDQGRRRI